MPRLAASTYMTRSRRFSASGRVTAAALFGVAGASAQLDSQMRGEIQFAARHAADLVGVDRVRVERRTRRRFGLEPSTSPDDSFLRTVLARVHLEARANGAIAVRRFIREQARQAASDIAKARFRRPPLLVRVGRRIAVLLS